MDKPVYQQDQPPPLSWWRKALSAGGWTAGAVLTGILVDLLKPALVWTVSKLYSGLIRAIDVLAVVHYRSIGRMDAAAHSAENTFDLLFLLTAFGVMLGLLWLEEYGLPKDGKDRERKLFRVATWCVTLSVTVLVVSVTGSWLAGVKRADFDTLVRAAAPYLTTNERLLIDSRLAVMYKSEEFDQLVADLEAVLVKNGVRTPPALIILPYRKGGWPQNPNEAK